LDSAVHSFYFDVRPSAVVGFLKELKGRKYKWDDIVAYLSKCGATGVSIGNMNIRTSFTYARSAIHNAMHMAGYVDSCDSPEDVYIRRDIFDKEYLGKKGIKKRRIKRRKR
jgi:hypothetical protein